MDKSIGVSYSKKREVIPKNCTKFNPYFKNIEIKNAIAYLKLRHDGCPKKDAMNYCSKTVCKHDSTKTRDGPSNFRKLKIRKDKNMVTHNGWIDSLPMFDMGKQYISSIFEIIKDPENQALVKSIKEADKEESDFKEKIRFLYKYYLEYIERTKVMNLKKIYDRIDAKRLIFD
jgi:hypothetical protein